MSYRFMESVQDEARFSNCVLKLLTLPRALIKSLRAKRGSIARDLGFKSVATYVLCCRVLEHLSHVPCPKKQAKAIQRLQVMLVGGLTKKRKGLKRPGACSQTRDRVFPQLQRSILEYLCDDIEKAFICDMDVNSLRNVICEADLFLESILGISDNAPSLYGVLPISIFSFVFLLAEMMLTGDTKSMKDIEGAPLQDVQHYEMYCALEKITMECLKGLHPGSGVLSGGDGRPQFSSTSGHGRDGQLVKIALSNKSLAGAVLIDGRLIAQSNVRKGKSRDNNDVFALNTFFPFLKEAVMNKKDESREYDGIMEDASDFLSSAGEVSLVADHNLKPFLQCYDTLLKCNRLSVSTFRGPGVVFRSNHLPDIIKNRQVEKYEGRSPIQETVLDILDEEVRGFRKDKAFCFDSQMEVVRVHEEDVTCYSCPFAKDLCNFFYASVKLAEKVAIGILEDNKKERHIVKTIRSFRGMIFRDLALGLFGCDLSGNLATLYEHYVFSSLIRHFHERNGIPKMLKAPDKRRTTMRNSRSHGKRRKGSRHAP